MPRLTFLIMLFLQLFVLPVAASGSMSWASDDSLFLTDNWLKAFSVRAGFDYGRTRVYDNYYADYDDRKFPTRSLFASIESPHRRCYVSLNAGILQFSSNVDGNVQTFGDVGGQGTPSIVYYKGYKFQYAERTTDGWASAKLHCTFARQSEVFFMSVSAGFGLNKSFRREVLVNEKISSSTANGTAYGPAHEYNIVTVNNASYDTSYFVSDAVTSYKSKRQFFELWLQWHFRVSERSGICFEFAKRYIRHTLNYYQFAAYNSFGYMGLSWEVAIGPSIRLRKKNIE